MGSNATSPSLCIAIKIWGTRFRLLKDTFFAAALPGIIPKGVWVSSAEGAQGWGDGGVERLVSLSGEGNKSLNTTTPRKQVTQFFWHSKWWEYYNTSLQRSIVLFSSTSYVKKKFSNSLMSCWTHSFAIIVLKQLFNVWRLTDTKMVHRKFTSPDQTYYFTLDVKVA